MIEAIRFLLRYLWHSFFYGNSLKNRNSHKNRMFYSKNEGKDAFFYEVAGGHKTETAKNEAPKTDAMYKVW